MNKYTIIVILVILLILGLGLGLWLSSKTETTTEEANNLPPDNQNQDQIDNTFTSEEDCTLVCNIIGYKEGECLTETKSASDIEEISPCLIEESEDCNQNGKCSCYCWEKVEAQKEENDDETGLANPATVYCEEQGGILEPRETEEGISTYCIFEDGSECEEWAYFNGECQPQD